jgi:phospholipid/cholesterol/gamma-HCH transport system substrate-binding protein
MKKPFKFRYVDEIVGGFVLAIVFLLVTGVILAGLAQSWFEPKTELRLAFPPEGSAGVQKGAEVVVLGTPVGTVERIQVNDDASMVATLIIRGEFTRFIRQDSEAILKKKFGVAGDAFIEITKGSGPALQGGVFPTPARKDTELLEMAQELVKQVRETTVPLLEQIRKAAEEYTALAADMRKPEGHLQQILANVEALTADLQKGEGTAGKLLKDPATVMNINKTIDSVNAAIVSVNDRLHQLEAILADVKKTTGALPEAMLQAQDTLRETETLIEGIQKHWLLRKYVNQASTLERIPIEETRFPEVNKP